MRMRIALLSLLTIACLAMPAMADINFYNNGAPNFTTDAWTINSGFAVSDSYMADRCGQGTCAVTDVSIGVWLFTPADGLDMTAQIDIGSTSFGTDGGSTVAIGSYEDQGFNQYGFDTGVETFVGLPLAGLPSGGPAWVTLSNAAASSGDPIYWDENSGPSLAFENSVGSIPSEAFTLSGHTTSTTPEPSSIMLFGSGILGLAGILRRRLNR